MKLGFYKFSKSPLVYVGYAYGDEIILKLPLTFFRIKLTRLQFNGALAIGLLDRHI